MAVRNAPTAPSEETREFVLGIAVGMAAMVAIVLLTLYGLGHISLGPSAPIAPRAAIAVDADDLDAVEAKPTAVWRFREEWLTPAPKARKP